MVVSDLKKELFDFLQHYQVFEKLKSIYRDSPENEPAT